MAQGSHSIALKTSARSSPKPPLHTTIATQEAGLMHKYTMAVLVADPEELV